MITFDDVMAGSAIVLMLTAVAFPPTVNLYGLPVWRGVDALPILLVGLVIVSAWCLWFLIYGRK